MIRQRPKLTDSDISFKNWGKSDFIKQTIELAKNLQEDPDKKERLQASECLVCWYRGGGMVTNACVHTNCKSCNKEMWFGNSNTDEICIDCAKELQAKNRKEKRSYKYASQPSYGIEQIDQNKNIINLKNF